MRTNVYWQSSLHYIPFHHKSNKLFLAILLSQLKVDTKSRKLRFIKDEEAELGFTEEKVYIVHNHDIDACLHIAV